MHAVGASEAKDSDPLTLPAILPLSERPFLSLRRVCSLSCTGQAASHDLWSNRCSCGDAAGGFVKYNKHCWHQPSWPLFVHQSVFPLTGVCSVRDGRIVRIRNYADKAEALEAAGLRE